MITRIPTFVLLFLGLCACLGFAPGFNDSRRSVAHAFERKGPEMEPKLVTKEEIKLIGIAVRTNNRQEADPATAKIPALYGRFFQEQVADKIPNKTALASMIAVYTKYESDHTGAYDLVIGREVNSLSSIPAGMTGVTIPAGKYLQFTAKGTMPKALIDTWPLIWNYFMNGSKLQRAYTTDYEVHSGSDEAEIYIAVK